MFFIFFFARHPFIFLSFYSYHSVVVVLFYLCTSAVQFFLDFFYFQRLGLMDGKIHFIKIIQTKKGIKTERKNYAYTSVCTLHTVHACVLFLHFTKCKNSLSVAAAEIVSTSVWFSQL